jgi:hypothetical protein
MFQYRDSGVYEVARGQVWRVGQHVFCCSDVVEDETLRSVVSAADLLYTDPPWSNPLQNQFRTLNELPPTGYDWTEIFKAALAIPTNAKWVVGDRYRRDEVASMMGTVQTWPLQGFTSPSVLAVLHYAGIDVTPPDGADALANLKDEKLPEAIMRLYPEPGTILDTCAGLGITSRCAERVGWKSVSNELIPNRMSAALRRLEKLSGEKPERIV